MNYKLLMVEDKPDFIYALKKKLANFNFKNRQIDFRSATNMHGAITLLREEHNNIAILFLDVVMEKEDAGLQLVEFVRKVLKNKYIRIIIITGEAKKPEAEIVQNYDINDYIVKTEISNSRIYNLISFQLDSYIASKNHDSQDRNKLRTEIFKKMGYCSKIKCLIEGIEKIADTDTIVFLQGETGVGKQLIAEYIHNYSSRVSGPFLDINCATIPENLFESEMFGYEPGAFTNASKTKIGIFELANNGTLFLDEINKVSSGHMDKLLKVIESMNIQRVGGEKKIKLNVRLIFAGNSDLKADISDGKISKDFYWRLSAKFVIPTLNERIEDIPHLAKNLLKKKSNEFNKYVDDDLDNDVLEKLKNHNWEGNYRELENVILNAVINAKTYKLCQQDLQFDSFVRNIPNPIYSISRKNNVDLQIFEEIAIQILVKSKEEWQNKKTEDVPCLIPLKTLQSTILETVYKKANNNKSLTAKLLGMTGNEQEIRAL